MCSDLARSLCLTGFFTVCGHAFIIHAPGAFSQHRKREPFRLFGERGQSGDRFCLCLFLCWLSGEKKESHLPFTNAKSSETIRLRSFSGGRYRTRTYDPSHVKIFSISCDENGVGKAYCISEKLIGGRYSSVKGKIKGQTSNLTYFFSQSGDINMVVTFAQHL